MMKRLSSRKQPAKKRGLGEEDLMHKSFGRIMRQYDGYGKLKCLEWTYDASGEKRDGITGSLLKAKGLNPGQSDYRFKYLKNNIAHYLYLEFKTKTGKQSDNQKRFEKTCIAENEKYEIARSVEEGLNALSECGLI